MADVAKDINNTGANPQGRDGSVPAEDDVRRALSTLMKASGKDRLVIAQAMSTILGRRVTPSMLADFTRNGTKKRQVRFPLAWGKAFSGATGNDELVRSQLLEISRRALSLGELLLPWLLERGQAELAQPAKRRRRVKR